MLIFIVFALITKGLEAARMYGPSVVKYAMVCGIMIAGIVMLFGAVGMRISSHLGSTIANGAFRAIGACFRTLARAIRWLFGMIPRIFRGIRGWLASLGLAPQIATVIAVIVTALII